MIYIELIDPRVRAGFLLVKLELVPYDRIPQEGADSDPYNLGMKLPYQRLQRCQVNIGVSRLFKTFGTLSLSNPRVVVRGACRELKTPLIPSALRHSVLGDLKPSFGYVVDPCPVRTTSKGGRQIRRNDARSWL